MEPAAVAQRLVRAKRKIRDAGIPIAEPPREQLPERIDGVLTVLYLVYTEGHTATGGDGPAPRRRRPRRRSGSPRCSTA